MINRCAYIFFVLMGILFFASCNKQEDALLPDEIANSNFIELQCILEDNNTVSHSSGEAGTKSLINQTNNTDEILCNFLRLDSKDGADWSKAYLSEGTIATVSTGSENLRSVSLHPAQPYNTTDKSSTSRMIGWYPRTDEVPQTAQGTDVTIQYENFSGTHVNVGDKTCIRFTGLDGSVDLMVSDMREGSYNDHFDYFAFKHYLSAIRVYAKSDRSAQDLGLWGEIHEVVIRKQPTSCVVEIPQEFDNANPLTITVNYTITTQDSNLNGGYAPEIAYTVTSDPIEINFKQGYAYTFVLNLGLDAVKFNVTSVTDWNTDLDADGNDDDDIPTNM